ncbi:MAG TPA: hypothetical protein VM287_05990 [Egibacteraceae bacterium]|nr:hypothetical protein [Egibacteraceae bacterium]
MTEDVRELVRQAGLQPHEPAPVDAIVRRARRRTVRRRVAYAVAPVLAGLAGLILVPGLLQHRVQFPPGASDGKDADAAPVVLPVPPVGEAAPQWHPTEGIPVFVVHHRDGDVSVVEPVNPHAITKVARPVGWCPQGYFEDPLHGSQFAPDGEWAGGPAPSDLVTYDTGPGPRPDSVEVGRRNVPQQRTKTHSSLPEISGPCGSPEGLVFHDAHPTRGQVHTPAQAVAEEPSSRWLLVDAHVFVDADGRQWACERPADGHDANPRCAGPRVPLQGLDAAGRTDSWLWTGLMWAVVTDDGLARPAHPLIDRLPPEPPDRYGDAPASGRVPDRTAATYVDGTLTVPAVDIDYHPPPGPVRAGRLHLVLYNDGGIDHTLVLALDDLDIRLEASPGRQDSTHVIVSPGEYVFYCDIPGHREAGMEAVLTVE